MLAGKACLAVGLLAWLACSDRLQFGRFAYISFDSRFAFLLVLVAGSMIVPALRWWWLLRIQGLRESATRVVLLTWAGYLAAMVMPGAAGGDLARSYLILRRRSESRARAFSTVLADRFIGLHSLLCIGAFSAVWMLAQGGARSVISTIALVSLTLLVLMTGGLIALLYAPSRQFLFFILPASWRVAWDESFVLYRNAIPELFGCFAMSVASSAMTVMSFAIAGRILGDVTSWGNSLLVGPLVIVANCLPITPGGIGLAEAVSSKLFSGLGSSGGAEIMILLRACGFAISLPGIIVAGALFRSAQFPSLTTVARFPTTIAGSMNRWRNR